MEFLSGNHVIALPDAVRIGSAILMGQFQNIIAETGIPVCHHLIQQEQSILPFLSSGLLQMGLPQGRKLGEEASTSS